MKKLLLVLLLGVFLFSFASASILSPSAIAPSNFGGANLSVAEDTLLDAWHSANSNVTKVFNNQVFTPWFSSSSSCAIANLKTDCYASPNMTAFCMVTDEFSEYGVGISMGKNQTRMQYFLNTLPSLNQSVGAGVLPAWRLSIDGGTVTSYLNDTASDADARIGIALYNCGNNTNFNSTIQSSCRTLADQYARDFVRYDLIYAPKYSSLGQGNISYHMITGRNIGINGAEGLGYGTAMYSGYYQDGIIFMIQAYVATGNTTYLNVARNITLDYLEAAKFNNVSFSVPPTAFEWDNLTGVMNVTCSRDCSPSAHWDDADAPRAAGLGMAEHYFNITGIPMEILTTYNNLWRTQHAQQFDSWTYRYWTNGSTYGDPQSGYKSQSLQFQIQSGGNNVSLSNATMMSAISHYSSGTQSMDSASCMGLYSPGMTIRSLGMAIGRDAGAYSVMSNGSNGTSYTNCTVNGILFTLFTPLNGSTILGTTATLSFSVQNNNVSDVTDVAPYTLKNYTFNSNDEGFTGNFNLVNGTDGYLNLTGNIFSPDEQLYLASSYRLIIQGQLGDTLVNPFKIYMLSPSGSTGNGDRYYFEYDAGTGTFAFKREPLYPTIASGIGKFSNFTIYIDVNKTGSWDVANITYSNTTISGSANGTQQAFSVDMNNSKTFNYSSIELSGAIGGQFKIYNWAIINTGNNVSYPDNSSMNVSIKMANGTVLSTTNGFTSGNTYNYNWTNPSVGNNVWYVNAVSSNNDVNSCNFAFTLNPYTNTSTVCYENGTCITPTGNTYLVEENSNLTITFDRDPLFWYRWLINGVQYAYGPGVTSFNHVYSSLAGNPNTNVTLQTHANSQSVYPTPTALENLVAYYRFDDNLSTTNVIDYTGLHNGTLTNAGNTTDASTTGQYLDGFRFDGINDYVALGSGIQLNYSAGFAYSAWANPTLINGSLQNYIIYTKNMSTTFPYFALYVRNSSGTNPQYTFRTQVNSTPCDVGITAPVDLNITNKWTHIVGVYNTTNLLIYINGSLAGTSATLTQTCRDLLSSLSAETINRTFSIGSTSTGTSGSFNGIIDEVRIYNSSLNSTQVAEIYNMGLIGDTDYFNITTPTLCTTPTDGMIVTTSTKFCSGTYQFNGSATNGSIKILANNVVLDCNGASFVGNNTSTFDAIVIAGTNNTVKNCILSNYFWGVRVNGYNNLTVDNITTLGTLDSLFYIRNSINSSILNSNSNGTRLALLQLDTNLLINNNTIPNINNGVGITINPNSTNYTITNNNFTNLNNSYAIRLYAGNHTFNIENNNFFNSTPTSVFSGVFIYLNGINGSGAIKGNTFNSSSASISLFGNGIANLNIQNNIFDDASKNGDSYNSGILISNHNNVIVRDNTFTKMGCTGILTQGTNNLSIINNSFGFSYQTNLDKNTNCAYEVPTAIDLASIWKTWISDGSESASDNVTKMLTYSAKNVNISGNTFSGFPVLLRASAPVNLTQDLSNYWYRSFASPNYLIPKQDYYISNSVNNLTTTFALVNNNPVSLSDVLGVRYPGSSTSTPFMSFKVYDTYSYFENTNNTQTYNTSLYNLTNSIVAYSNGTNVSVIGTNQEYNLTLAPSAYAYVYTNIEVVPPLINFISPTEANNANKSQNWIYMNTNWTEDHLKNITFWVDTTPAVYLTAQYDYNATGLTNGGHTYYVQICDIFNQCNQTETRTITLDMINPTGTNVAPSNGSSSGSSSNNFTANVSDNITGVQNATLSIYNSTGLVNQTNITVNANQSFIGRAVTLVDNVYHWFYTIFDFAGNRYDTINSTLTIDTINPYIVFVSPTPANGVTINNTGLSINVTASDINLVNITINLYNATQSLVSSVTTTSSPNFYTFTDLPDGTYYYNATAIDITGASNSTSTRGVVLVTPGPYVHVISYDTLTKMVLKLVGGILILISLISCFYYLNVRREYGILTLGNFVEVMVFFLLAVVMIVVVINMIIGTIGH